MTFGYCWIQPFVIEYFWAATKHFTLQGDIITKNKNETCILPWETDKNNTQKNKIIIHVVNAIRVQALRVELRNSNRPKNK